MWINTKLTQPPFLSIHSSLLDKLSVNQSSTSSSFSTSCFSQNHSANLPPNVNKLTTRPQFKVLYSSTSSDTVWKVFSALSGSNFRLVQTFSKNKEWVCSSSKLILRNVFDVFRNLSVFPLSVLDKCSPSSFNLCCPFFHSLSLFSFCLSFLFLFSSFP